MYLNLVERVVTEDYIIYSILGNKERYKNKNTVEGLYFNINLLELTLNHKILELLNLPTYWYCRYNEIKIFHNIKKITKENMIIGFKKYLQNKMKNSPNILDNECFYIFIADLNLASEILPHIKNLL